MGPLSLQAKHGPSQVRSRHGPGLGGGQGLTDLVILAKYTAQVTAGEKDRPRASAAGEGGLLTVMQAEMGDQGLTSDSTKPEFPRQSIDPALAGAATAMMKLVGKLVHGQ